ncbi:MAG: hypothetical protein Q9166_000487 [cf. Caloplaca sp. 2 TL-2023]
MVAISLVRSSNESLRNLPPHLSSPTAVFTGATQGIGLAMLRQLAIHTATPTCYIVGRSEAKTQEINKELKDRNGKGTYISVKGEVALLESVDECCQKIKDLTGEGKGIDMLFMSQGYLTSEGRSVLTGDQENKINKDDLDLKHNYGVLTSAYHGTTMTTLAFEHLAKENPKIAFAHVYPGYVATDILQSGFSWPVAAFFKYILQTLISFLAIPLPDVGARQLFHATSARYPAKSPPTAEAGAKLRSSDLSVSDGEPGSGFYIVDQASERAPSGTSKLMKGYWERGVPEKVWRHTVEMFGDVRGK